MGKMEKMGKTVIVTNDITITVTTYDEKFVQKFEEFVNSLSPEIMVESIHVSTNKLPIKKGLLKG